MPGETRDAKKTTCGRDAVIGRRDVGEVIKFTATYCIFYISENLYEDLLLFRGEISRAMWDSLPVTKDHPSYYYTK